MHRHEDIYQKCIHKSNENICNHKDNLMMVINDRLWGLNIYWLFYVWIHQS